MHVLPSCRTRDFLKHVVFFAAALPSFPFAFHLRPLVGDTCGTRGDVPPWNRGPFPVAETMRRQDIYPAFWTCHLFFYSFFRRPASPTPARATSHTLPLGIGHKQLPRAREPPPALQCAANSGAASTVPLCWNSVRYAPIRFLNVFKKRFPSFQLGSSPLQTCHHPL